MASGRSFRTVQLQNGKSVDITGFEDSGRTDFSVALQVPVKDEKAVAELARRREYYLEKFPKYKEYGEANKNFHITILLVFPTTQQIQPLIEIYEQLLKKYKDQFEITITDEPDFMLGGFEKFPVAKVTSDTLQLIHFNFKNMLREKGIRDTDFPSYIVHSSLFFYGIRGDITADSENCPRSEVTFSGTMELSHKNACGYHTLDSDDLRELSETLNPQQIAVAPSHMNYSGYQNLGSSDSGGLSKISGQQQKTVMEPAEPGFFYRLLSSFSTAKNKKDSFDCKPVFKLLTENEDGTAFEEKDFGRINSDEKLKRSLIVLHQVLPALVTRRNFHLIKDNIHLQDALFAAHGYLNSGRFGFWRTHGKHGQNETNKFVKKLMASDVSREDTIRLMKEWIKTSNVNNSSRAYYACSSALFKPAAQQQEAKAINYVTASTAERKNILKTMKSF